MNAEIDRLTALAMLLVGEMPLGGPGLSAATVAAVVQTRSGAIYTGASLHLACGVGFCAEHAAIAEMVKARETELAVIETVASGGSNAVHEAA